MMHERTAELRRLVRAADSPDQALSVLQGAYAGDTLVVVTCGPSLGGYATAQLKEALEGIPTVAVKQAIDVVGESADFLCFNSFNVTRFVTPSPATIRIYQRPGSDRWPQLNSNDLELVGESHGADLKQSLAVARLFDDFRLDDTPIRPWGPGIMYELVIYLAVHLGVRRVVTIGWDIATLSGSNRHFYDAEKGAFFDQSRSDAYFATGVRAKLPDALKVSLRRLRAAQAHIRGRVYNKTLMLDGEADVTAAASGAVAEWLHDNGVELIVASPTSLVDKEISRVDTSELWKLLEALRA